MKRTTLGIVLIVALGATALAQTEPQQQRVTVEELIRMIGYVEEQPFSPASEDIFPLIIQVATTTDMVTISLNEDTVPWLAQIQDQPWARYVVGGYIAGNMRYQLENQVTEDNPEAGFRFALSVYRKLKAINPEISVEAFEVEGL